MNSSQLFGTSGFKTDLPKHGKAMPLGGGGHQADCKPVVNSRQIKPQLRGAVAMQAFA